MSSYLVPRSDACRGRGFLLLLLWSGGGCCSSCCSCCSSSRCSSCCCSSCCSLCRRDRRDGKLRGPHRGAPFPPGPDRRAERGRLEPPVIAEAQHRRRRDAGVVRGPARRLGVRGADALCRRRRRRCGSAIRALVGGISRPFFLALDHAREAAAHVDLEGGPGATPGRHGSFPQFDAWREPLSRESGRMEERERE